MCACFKEKSQIVWLSTFGQREFKKKMTEMCLGCENR